MAPDRSAQQTPVQRPPAVQRPRTARAAIPPDAKPVDLRALDAYSTAITDDHAAPTVTPQASTPPVTPTALVGAPAEPISAAAPASTPAPSSSLQIPPPQRLSYRVSGESRKLQYSASGELLWQHDGNHYTARMEVGAFLLGKRIQTSEGSLGPEGLAPTRFSDRARSEVAAHFERARGVVVFSANTPEAPLLAGAQDRVSVLLQLSALLAGSPERFPAGTRIALPTVGPREAEIWQFVVEDDDTLHLPLGALNARKLARLPQRQFDLTVEVWLAPSLGWLPAQVKLTQANGDFVQMALESLAPP